jgi:hypothetical protein
MRAIENTTHTSKAAVAAARSARMNEAKMNAIWDGMDAADCNAVAQVISFFMAPGPRTGRSA